MRRTTLGLAVLLLGLVGGTARLCFWNSSARSSGHAETPWTNPKDSSVLVYVPAGRFTMGSDSGEIDEYPPHQVFLDGYWIGKYLVTNRQFVLFLNACGNQTDHGLPWLLTRQGRQAIKLDAKRFSVDTRYARCPVTGVSWYGACAYCRWVDARLPTEAEWEKAARGTDGRTYPWGNAWRADRANGAHGIQLRGIETTEVDAYPLGASPYGCLDMAGNAWEWCSSIYARYPYSASDGREAVESDAPRVIRGGGFNMPRVYLRTANRYRIYPEYTLSYDYHHAKTIGFRIARSHTPLDPSPSSPATSLSTAAGQALHRAAHPPMVALTHEDPPPPSPDLDRRYRLTAGTYPYGVILGYPVTREREARYPIPWERLRLLEIQTVRDGVVPRQAILKLLHLAKGDVVADVGAGSGYFTLWLSRAVGASGQVWATEISAGALRYLQERLQTPKRWRDVGGLSNVHLLLHDVTDCLLPPAILDVAFLSEVHYFYYPRAKKGTSPPLPQVLSFYRSIRRALKRSDGRLVIWEESDRQPQQDPDRGTLSVAEIAAQMKAAGLRMCLNRRFVIGNNAEHPKFYIVREFMVFKPDS